MTFDTRKFWNLHFFYKTIILDNFKIVNLVLTLVPKQFKQINVDVFDGPTNRGFSWNKISPAFTFLEATRILWNNYQEVLEIYPIHFLMNALVYDNIEYGFL